MSLYGLFARPGPSGFGYNSTAEQVSVGLDLTGRRYLVTGSNSGLGMETMRVLALRGATVIGAARSIEKAQQACGSVSGTTVPVACELGDPTSVRAAVETIRAQGEALDGIITNAGIMALPKREVLFGYEKQFFVNHVGHFILVTGLLDQLSADGRVVSLSSSAHTGAPPGGIEFDNLSGERGYAAWRAYGQAKLANLLFARELARRMAGTGQVACAVHPGVIATNLGRHLGVMANMLAVAGPLVLKSIPQGAATQVWAAVTADPETILGQYLHDSNVQTSSKDGQDLALAAKLWEKTEEIVAGLPA
jgi:NAD(P)-dependent dehydrogenase (short-subunit alcohol dehydrogenase family)